MFQCSNMKGGVDKYHSLIDSAIMTFSTYEFVFCTLLFLCTFWLRNINDEFSINTEIRAMTTMLFITDFLYLGTLILFYNSAFVSLGFVEYFKASLSLFLLYLTAIRPILKSY